MGYVSLNRKGVIEKCDTSMKLCDQKRERRLPRLPFLFLGWAEARREADPGRSRPHLSSHGATKIQWNNGISRVIWFLVSAVVYESHRSSKKNHLPPICSVHDASSLLVGAPISKSVLLAERWKVCFILAKSSAFRSKKADRYGASHSGVYDHQRCKE